MKKTITCIAVLSILIVTITGTAKAQKGLYVGVQGAPQLSVMFNEDDVTAPGTDYKSKFSYTFGVNAGYNFTKRMGIGTEVMYSTVRQRFEKQGGSYDQHLSYLKIPVLFTYNSHPDARLVFTAKAGPQVSLLMNSAIKNADNASMNGDNKSRYKDIVFGATAGAGVRFRLTGNMHLTTGLRFDGSFGSIEDGAYNGPNKGRARTYDLNSGVEVGVKYFLN